MTGTIARKVIATFRSLPPAPASPVSPTLSALAPREQAVLEMFAENHSYKEIADKLGISATTVGTYVTRIYEKLHVHSRREVIELHNQ